MKPRKISNIMNQIQIFDETGTSVISENLFSLIFMTLYICCITIKGKKSIRASDLIESLCTAKRSVYHNFDDGKPITIFQLDYILMVYGIKSKIIPYTSGKTRGYYGKCFDNFTHKIYKPLLDVKYMYHLSMLPMLIDKKSYSSISKT